MTLWFPEPVVADATDGRDDETMAEWLDRSTVPRAVEARRFLNENLAALPEQEQPQFYKLFRERWKSTLFEIIVARTLQTIGSTLVIEPEGFEGKRIDFMASFPDMVVAVEAKAPEMNRTVLQQNTENQPLVEIIKQLIPPRWWVAIARLPNIGARDSKRQFRQRIEAIFARLPPSGQDNETIEVYEELPTGLIMMWIASTSTSPGALPRILLFPMEITLWRLSKRQSVERGSKQEELMYQCCLRFVVVISRTIWKTLTLPSSVGTESSPIRKTGNQRLLVF